MTAVDIEGRGLPGADWPPAPQSPVPLPPPPAAPAPAPPVPAAPAQPAPAPAAAGAAGFVRRHRLLLVALGVLAFYHGALLLSGSYQRTYDAYVHIFMADHYRRGWFDTWDDRWYTGFTTVSYPPGSHYAIAALSSLVGLRGGFVIVQLFALCNLTLGVYRWSRIWVDERAAGWAAILLVVSSSISETVHVFGQLPTTFSLGFLLNALPFAHRYVRTGRAKWLLLGLVCTMGATAGHHVTTLFGAVFFVGPVLISALVIELRAPLPDEPGGHLDAIGRTSLWPVVARRLRRVMRPFGRTMAFGTLMVMGLVIVVLPYWLSSLSDPITQVTIPHASRDNYLVNTNAGLVFWLIPWGTTLIVLPYALLRGFTSNAWPLALSLAGLTFLGTGGTTPLPKMLLGGAYEILTLDRFTFWATISILPLAGALVTSTIDGTVRAWLVHNFGRRLAGLLPMMLATTHIAFTLFSANLTHYRPFQPQAIDPGPIVSFLNKDEHWRWRYLALGFGDQMAWLSANTTAQTVDGNYHSARRLPELTSRPVERLEGAKYSGLPGIGSLQQFLAVPERYNLKYVFNNDAFYAPLLNFSGWHELGTLENGIMVWERADVPPLPDTEVDREVPRWQRLMWGIIPPSSMLSAILLLAWASGGARVPGRVSRALRWANRLLWRMPGPNLGSRLVARIDRKLLSASGRISAERTAETPRLRSMLERLRRRAAHRYVSPLRRRFQATAVILAMLAGLGWVGYRHWPVDPTPVDVVKAYYDDLDFNRQTDAYARLDPRTAPSFADYQVNLSRNGGLVASFGKLKSIVATVTEETATGTTVTAELTFLTSLEEFHMTRRMVTRWYQNAWRIDLPPAEVYQPPDQFVQRQGVTFLEQGRRAIAADGTPTADVQDRPQLAFGSVRSLLADGRWVVVGEVTNMDVDPADVTVNAQIRDKSGRLLASWDAAQVLIHKLLPGETSPFRIEFQRIAGLGAYGTEVDGGVKKNEAGPDAQDEAAQPASKAKSSGGLHGPVEFDPLQITPLVLGADDVPASVAVYARAVVTPRGTTRGLQVTGLHVTESDGQSYLEGEIRNDMTVEAAIPHLLMAYTAADGQLAWVDHAYLADSIAPQRRTKFRIPLADGTDIKGSGLPTAGYTGADDKPQQAPRRPVMLRAPESSGFAGITVYASTYIRGGR
ncbi:hypothetical protein AB0J80_21235 [Actinoplanes sp. NPDC049548]|uniref:hypothetical protein n=1 Tax=Actinoplanes sp. NPDC049548 TaxID=3155152 RepID=UPI003445CE49